MSENTHQCFTDMYSAFEYLHKHRLLDITNWRKFHCACCREIWDYFDDPCSKNAVEYAEYFLRGTISQLELQVAYESATIATDEAWTVVQGLRIPADENVWIWPLNQEVDNAFVRFNVASATKQCAELGVDRVFQTMVPDAASVVRAWANARTTVINETEKLDEPSLRKAIEKRFEEIRQKEERRQLLILMEMFNRTCT